MVFDHRKPSQYAYSPTLSGNVALNAPAIGPKAAYAAANPPVYFVELKNRSASRVCELWQDSHDSLMFG